MYKYILILFAIPLIFIGGPNLIHPVVSTEIHHKRHYRHNIPDIWTMFRMDHKKIDGINVNNDDDNDNIDSYSVSNDSDENPPLEINDNNDNHITLPKCPNCKRQGVHMTAAELTDLRIEFVKNQILQKLRLKERPKVLVSGLPKPVKEGAIIHHYPYDENNMKRSDEFYARTTQKIIFLREDKEQCRGLSDHNPSKCFSFQIPGDVDVADVNVAELWIYKEKDIMDHHNQTFVVSEMGYWDQRRRFLKSKPIAIQETDIKEGWLKIDIAWAAKNWFQYNTLTHVIHVACKTCGMSSSQSPMANINEMKPFIVIDTNPKRKVHREKRSINCSAGITECCREKLYISFADIGWDDWILHPPGYHAYFCRGSCSSAAAITLSGSHYNSVLRKFIYQKNQESAKKLELVPCCTATQFSSLQLFYLDSNQTATQKTLPNMVVEGCGCM